MTSLRGRVAIVVVGVVVVGALLGTPIVDRSAHLGAAATPDPIQLPGTLRFDQPRYDLPGCAKVTLFFSGPGRPSLEVFAQGTSDHEHFDLVAGVDPATWVTPDCIRLSPAAVKPGDGRLEAEDGDDVFVFARTSDTDVVAIGAFMTMGEGPAKPRPDVPIDPAPLPPALASGPLGPNARLVGPDGTAAYFAEQVVAVSEVVPGDLQHFLTAYGGRDLGSMTLSNATGGPGRVYHTVSVDPKTLSDSGFAGMLARNGVNQGTLTFSSRDARRLMTMITAEQIAGMAVWPELLYLGQDAPVSDEGGADNFARPWFNPLEKNGRQALRAGEAMALLDVTKAQNGPQTPLAVVDGGFGGPNDFGGGFTPPDYGAPSNDYNNIKQCRMDNLGNAFCGPGVAQGSNPNACQGGSGCPWHGLQMAGIAGGRFNNGSGLSAGVGGQVSELRFYKLDFVYTLALAGAIGTAAKQGAKVISISSGAPCVLGIDLCDGGVRAGLIALCASLPLLLFLGGIGAVAAAAACAAMVVAATYDAIANAVKTAIALDAVVDAASGNSPTDPFTVKWFPCVLPGVVCVGGLMEGAGPAPVRDNTLAFGSRIDIWAPGNKVVAMPDPSSPGATQLIGGTSPATAFLSGVAAIARALDPALTAAQTRLLLNSTACRTGNTARIVGPACVASSDSNVDGAGYVDVLEVVRSARAMAGRPSLGNCTGGFDERTAPTGDAPATPVSLGAIPAAQSGVLVELHGIDSSNTRLDQVANGGVDTRYYGFTFANLLPNIKAINVRASLTVPDPTLGTMSMAFYQVSGGIGPLTLQAVPLSLNQDSSSGTAMIQAALILTKKYVLQVIASSPIADNSNCWTDLVLEARESDPGPPPHEPWLEAGNALIVSPSEPGFSGTGTAPTVILPVTLTAPVNHTVKVNTTFTDLSAVGGIDYDSAAVTVTMVAGQTSAEVPVGIIGHPGGGSRAFQYQVNSADVAIGKPSGYVVIFQAASTAVVQIGDVEIYEGDASTNLAHITFTLDRALPDPVDVTFHTADGTATTPIDYAPVSGTVTIPKNTLFFDLFVSITTDTFPEYDSFFMVVLDKVSSASPVALGTRSIGSIWILDDDPRP